MDNLPRFTLLHGSFQSTVNFAKELMNRSSNIVNIDFEEPILDGIIATMFDGDILSFDPNDFAVRCGYLPDTKVVFQDWVNELKDRMRVVMGPDILAKIFIKEFREIGFDYQHIVIRDADHVPDIQCLLKSWHQREFCLVNLGPLTETFMTNAGIHRCYWIATTDPKAQVDELFHQLNNERAA